MNLTITRIDGAVRVTPAPPYLVEYLRYSHRSFKTERYQRVNHFETRLLHRIDGEGGIITLQGFFEKICKLIHKNNDTFVVEDQRTPLPEIDWNRVKEIGLRDYQVEPVTEFLLKAKEHSGIVNATGGLKA